MSKKEITTTERRRNIQALIQRVNKKAKREVITTADQAPNPYMLRYPTGCMEIDIDLGGGFPAGGMSAISGPDGAGKTLLLYMAMAMHQRIFGDASAIALAPTEFIPDYFFMRAVGVDIAIPDEMIEQTNRVRAQRGMPLFTKEEIKTFKSQTGEFLIIRGSTGQQILDGVLECYASKQFGIIGVDSINAIQSAAEASSDGLEDSIQQAAKASIMSRFSDRFHPLTLGIEGPNYTSLIVTGQVRANRERANAASHMQKYIKNYAEVLPWAIRHAALIRVLLWQGEKIRGTSGDEKGIQQGQVRQWEITKGKAGTHDGIRGEADYTYGHLFDNYGSVIRMGMKWGVIREKQGQLLVIRPLDGTVAMTSPSPDALVASLRSDVVLDVWLRQEILTAAGKSCLYKH